MNGLICSIRKKSHHQKFISRLLLFFLFYYCSLIKAQVNVGSYTVVEGMSNVTSLTGCSANLSYVEGLDIDYFIEAELSERFTGDFTNPYIDGTGNDLMVYSMHVGGEVWGVSLKLCDGTTTTERQITLSYSSGIGGPWYGSTCFPINGGPSIVYLDRWFGVIDFASFNIGNTPVVGVDFRPIFEDSISVPAARIPDLGFIGILSNAVQVSLSSIDLGNDTTLCPGQTITLDAFSTGATYSWSDNSTDTTLTVSQPGIYWVDVTFGDGCIFRDSIVVNYVLLPNNILGNDTVLCNAQNITLDAFFPGASYRWHNTNSSRYFNVTQPGTYWVDLTLGTCTNRDSINVEFLEPSFLGNDTSLCRGETMILDATTIGANYAWQDGSSNPTYNVVQSGQYWVDIITNVCTIRDTINVSLDTVALDLLGSDSTLCQGQVITLNAATSGATYAWQNTSTLTTFNVTQSGIYWVDVSIGNCTERDSIQIDYLTVQTNLLGNDSTLCRNQTLVLNATTLGASYLWGNNLWQTTTTGPTYNIVQAGTYWVDIAVGNCLGTDTIVVDYNLIPLHILGNDSTLCEGEILTLNATTFNATYQWSDNSTNTTIAISSPGIYWVDITVDNCTERDTNVVDYIGFPSNILGNDTLLCNGQSLTMDASLPNSNGYMWFDNSIAPASTISSPGIYWVDVLMAHCIQRDSIQVEYFDPSENFLGNDTTLCEGQSLVLNAMHPFSSYLWSDNSTNSTFQVTQPNLYWVDVRINNCIETDSIQVDYLSPPSVDLGNDTAICDGESISLNASYPSANYLWQDLSNDSIFNATLSGQYQVEVSNRCASVFDQISIEVESCDCPIFIPNSFTPNDDGINDTFLPILHCDPKDYHLLLFNRWGEKAFESFNINEGWDGTFQEKEPIDGIYIYKVVYKFDGTIENTNSGSVSIIK